MDDEALDTPQFHEALLKISAETGRSMADLEREAEGDLSEMATRPGKYTVAGWDRFCHWLARAYKLDYLPQEVEELKRLNRDSALVFLPNHRSYLDPLVLRSALEKHGFPQQRARWREPGVVAAVDGGAAQRHRLHPPGVP